MCFRFRWNDVLAASLGEHDGPRNKERATRRTTKEARSEMRSGNLSSSFIASSRYIETFSGERRLL